MPTFRLVLIAMLSSLSTLFLAAGCDAVRSSLTSSATPTVEQAPAVPPPTSGQATAPAAQVPTVAQPASVPAAQSSPPVAQPVAAGQSPPKPGAVAAPVAQAAPAAQGANPYDTVSASIATGGPRW